MSKPQNTPPKGGLKLNERLVIALDVSDLDQARALVDRLSPVAPIFKIGYHSLFGGGLELAQDLVRQGLAVFLDAKLYDIPKTVEGGVRSLAAQGFWCLTVHAQAQNVRGALKGAAGTELKVLGVTVLTSMTDQDLILDGLNQGAGDQVLRRADQALAAGAHGLIASAQEAAALRQKFGGAPLLITPGIRPAGSEAGDQARIMTPAQAIAAGADALVVGRPIIAAQDPLAAARGILDDIADALEI